MFDLKKPCSNCPFRKGQGERFNLGVERCLDIFNATAFQCHKTVDYDQWEDERKRQGRNPQQCVGVMSLLHRANLPNQIMQIAERLGGVDFGMLDHSAVYSNIGDALEAHSQGVDWAQHLAGIASIGRARQPKVISGAPTRGRMPTTPRAWERSVTFG